MSCFYF